jgi:hypothetical protein
MSKEKMPWNKIQVPNVADAQMLEKTFEDEVLAMLERPLRDAIRRSFVKSFGVVARGPMDDKVKPPKDGTKCAAIWGELDGMRATGVVPKLGNILHVAEAKGWNQATTRTQYATWRRYHGIPAQEKQVA